MFCLRRRVKRLLAYAHESSYYSACSVLINMASFRSLKYKCYLSNSGVAIPRETKRRRGKCQNSCSDDEEEHLSHNTQCVNEEHDLEVG